MLVQLERDGALDIPAGQRDFVISDEFRLPVDVDVLGVYPHAHYLGREMKAWVTLRVESVSGSSGSKIGTLIGRLSIAMRNRFNLPRGTLIAMRYTYDNSSENPAQSE